jgi:hypothetical protein
MERRRLLVFLLLVVLAAALHAGWEAWESYAYPGKEQATSSGSADSVCTACGPMRGAKPAASPAGNKRAVTTASTVDINGLEPFEVDTPHSPPISSAGNGFTP